jgi:hypothetical protein
MLDLSAVTIVVLSVAEAQAEGQAILRGNALRLYGLRP